MRITRLTKQLMVPIIVNFFNSVYNPETLSSELNVLTTGDLIGSKTLLFGQIRGNSEVNSTIDSFSHGGWKSTA
jgi:hypothetical protein